jgi:hypothetical protein
MPSLIQAEALRQQKVLLITHRPDVPLKASGALGEVTLHDTIYNPILDLLADHKPKTLGQIEQTLVGAGITFSHIIQAVMLLTGSGHLAAVQDETVTAKTRKQTDRLNTHLIQLSRGTNDISYLASPVTGGGITVGRFQQLFVLALQRGKKQPTEWAQFVWDMLAAQGQKLLKDGNVLETAEDNLAELTSQATVFAEKQLPILKALGIA